MCVSTLRLPGPVHICVYWCTVTLWMKREWSDKTKHVFINFYYFAISPYLVHQHNMHICTATNTSILAQIVYDFVYVTSMWVYSVALIGAKISRKKKKIWTIKWISVTGYFHLNGHHSLLIALQRHYCRAAHTPNSIFDRAFRRITTQLWICHQFFWRWYNWTRQTVEATAQCSRSVLFLENVLCTQSDGKEKRKKKTNGKKTSFFLSSSSSTSSSFALVFDFLLLRLTVSSRQSVHIYSMYVMRSMIWFCLFFFLSFVCFFFRGALFYFHSVSVANVDASLHSQSRWHRQRRRRQRLRWRRQRPVSDHK